MTRFFAAAKNLAGESVHHTGEIGSKYQDLQRIGWHSCFWR